MLSKFRNLFSAAESAPPPAVSAGSRVYAVGDVHGRADLFAALIAAIDADDAERAAADTTIVLLGDLVDRGPNSSGVVALARDWQARRPLRALMGNHEEMFLDSFDSEEVLRQFLRFGGKETVLSYPIDPVSYTAASLAETQELMHAAVPAADIAFMRAMEDMVTIGDYLFVHAGIRPGVPLDQQRIGDLRWIREPFTTCKDNLGPVVVYGHTIYETPEIGFNRIGIDTGAYQSGRLTAIGLEGINRWLIEAKETGGTISVSQRSVA
jgi:serine/threonine protein phosphatase 1